MTLAHNRRGQPPAPGPLMDDLDLIKAMEKEMKFVEDPELQLPEGWYIFDSSSSSRVGAAINKVYVAQRDLIKYFEDAYGATDQDTVTYGPEFVIVVRNILAGRRPVKLRFLTDFEGEEK